MPAHRKLKILGYLAIILGPPIALSLLVIHYTEVSLGPHGTLADARLAAMTNVGGGVFPLALMLIGMVALVYVATRKAGAIIVAACIAFTINSAILTEFTWRMRLEAFRDLAERSTVLIEAIQDYRRIRNKLPEKLSYLTPDYISSVPNTGIAIYPNYDLITAPQSEPYGEDEWYLVVRISDSPRSELVYSPTQEYDAIDGEQIPIGDWIYSYSNAILRE